MNFIIDEIVLNNFFLFENQTIPLYNQGLVLLKGDNVEQPWKGGNSVGKTGLGDAVSWLLSGATSRDIQADSVIGKFNKSCSVKGKIRVAQTQFELARYRKDPLYNNSLQIHEQVNVSHRRIKDTQERLDDIIGCSWKLLRLSCFQYGNKSEYFSRLKPVDRAQILDEIVGASEADIPSRYTKINHMLREHQEKAQEIVLSNSRLRMQIEMTAKIVRDNEAVIKSSEETLQLNINTLKSKVNKYDHDKYMRHVRNIEELELEMEKADSINKAIEEINLTIERVNKEDKDEQISIGKLSYMAESYNEKMSLKISAGVKCDKCGSLVKQETLDSMVAEAKQKYDSIHNEIVIIKNRRIKIKQQLAELIEKKNEVKIPNLQAIKFQIDNNKLIINQELKNKNAQDQLDKDIIILKERHEASIKELKDNNIGYISQIKSAQDSIVKNIFELHKTNRTIDVLEMLQQFYSPNGFRPLVMEYYAPVLSDCANYFFNDFTNGQGKILIDSKRTLASGKVIDKVDIQVYENNKARQFPGEWSEGEGGYIDLSLNLGIMKLAAEKAAKEFNFLFLDEITNGLSQKWITILISFLKDKIIKDGMTVLMTSHMPVNEALFDKVWTVRRNNGKATIDFGKQ